MDLVKCLKFISTRELFFPRPTEKMFSIITGTGYVSLVSIGLLNCSKNFEGQGSFPRS